MRLGTLKKKNLYAVFIMIRKQFPNVLTRSLHHEHVYLEVFLLQITAQTI